MANIKNSARRKRKYGDARKGATARNKARTPLQHAAHMEKLSARTGNLVGKAVKFRQSGYKQPMVGVVKSITRAPEGALRKIGNYLVIQDSSGALHVKSRHRVKPVGDTRAV